MAQIVYNTRTFQKKNIYRDIDDPKIYLTRYLNLLLKVFKNIRIIGCEGFFVNLVNGNIFKVAVSPGKIILDSTLIEFPTAVLLDIDLNQFSFDYDEVLVVARYKYLDNNNKARLQLILRNSTTNGVTDVITSEEFIIVGRFKLIRENNKVVFIKHPYGQFIKKFYSEHLHLFSPFDPAVNNKVYEKLVSDMELFKPFLINGIEKQLLLPLDFNMELLSKSIIDYFSNKLYYRYKISDLFQFYYNKIDRNLQFKTGMFDD